MSSHPARSTPSWFDSEHPPLQRHIETCIHCGLCLTACPTYRELKIEPDSPRGRLYLIRGLAEGRIGPEDELVQHLDNCLGCRACETVCPAGVPYGRLLEETRAQLTRRRPSRSPAAALGRWALERVVPHRERMHLAMDLLRIGQTAPLRALLGSRLARRILPAFAVQGLEMTPELLPRRERSLERLAGSLPPGARMERRDRALRFHPAGEPRARVGFFTSCVQETMFPRVNHEAVRLLALAGCEVVVPDAQTCCGALQAHAGLGRKARALGAQNVAAFGDDLDYVVTTSAGCGATLRELDHVLPPRGGAEEFARRVRDVSEVLAGVGLPEPAPVLGPLRVTYHDACHLAHGQKVREEPRALLRRVPGIRLLELPNADWCCGSAGVYNLTHPAMADAQLARKLDTVESVTPDVVVASNPGCLLHMQRGARARGSAARFLHLVELLGMAWPPGSRAA